MVILRLADGLTCPIDTCRLGTGVEVATPMRWLREFVVAVIIFGTFAAIAWVFTEIGLLPVISLAIGLISSLALWWFVSRKLRRYRIVQIVFNVDNHSVLRDE